MRANYGERNRQNDADSAPLSGKWQIRGYWIGSVLFTAVSPVFNTNTQFPTRSFAFNGVEQDNRNPLLYGFAGADGLKTGHTEEAGYGLAASAIRDGRRLISVVSGLPSKRARGQESERLLEWGFRSFDNRLLFRAGETIARAPVWMGERPNVDLVVTRDVVVSAPRADIDALPARALYTGPAPAPLAA